MPRVALGRLEPSSVVNSGDRGENGGMSANKPSVKKRRPRKSLVAGESRKDRFADRRKRQGTGRVPTERAFQIVGRKTGVSIAGVRRDSSGFQDIASVFGAPDEGKAEAKAARAGSDDHEAPLFDENLSDDDEEEAGEEEGNNDGDDYDDQPMPDADDGPADEPLPRARLDFEAGDSPAAPSADRKRVMKQVDAFFDDEPAPAAVSDSEEEEVEEDEAPAPAPAKKKTPKSAHKGTASAAAPKSAAKRGRPAAARKNAKAQSKKKKQAEVVSESEEEEEGDDDDENDGDSAQDEEEEEEEEPAPKRRAVGKKAAAKPKAKPKAKKSGKAESRRRRRGTMQVINIGAALVEESMDTAAQTADSHTPGVRRSRRARIAPLQFWKGERVVLTRDSSSAAATVMPVVQQVLRAPPTPAPKKRSSRPRKHGGGAKKKARRADEDDDDADEGESSEELSDEDEACAEEQRSGTAVIYDHVSRKNRDRRVVVSSADVVGQELPSEGDGTVLAHKAFHTNAWTSGMMEIPPGTRKVRETAAKDEVFFVYAGKPRGLEVRLATPDGQHEHAFVLSPGDYVRVPAGNVYSMRNRSARTTVKAHFVLLM